MIRFIEASGRGHKASDVTTAVRIIKNKKLQCGIQMMPGLPEEDLTSLITTTQGIINLRPDFVRIYPTLVIANTKLAEMFADGSYQALSLQEGIVRGAF